jgi:hypothetical protein
MLIAKAGKNAADLDAGNTVAKTIPASAAPVSGGGHEGSAKFFTRLP